jgi:Cof subfamily protein (haloacid dehalogenase superfamily)
VRAIATDLDGTILDGVTFSPSPRTIAAVRAAEACGIHVILATGRMFQSARRIAEQLEVHTPLICYQGGLVADPDTGEWLLHRPLSVDLAAEILRALGPHARTTNAYVDDELFVTEANTEAIRYAEIAGVEMHVVGDLASWLTRPTTKLVTVGEESWLDPLRDAMQARFAGRAFVAKSLPIFLEFAAPDVSKSSALAFLGTRLGFTAACRSATARTTATCSSGRASECASPMRASASSRRPTGWFRRSPRMASRSSSSRS